MKAHGALSIFMIVAGLDLNLAAASNPLPDSSAELHIWNEFVDLLQAGPFPSERIAPYQENLREPLGGFLSLMRSKADWVQWRRVPEIFTVDRQVHFLTPLTFDGDTETYCFSF